MSGVGGQTRMGGSDGRVNSIGTQDKRLELTTVALLAGNNISTDQPTRLSDRTKDYSLICVTHRLCCYFLLLAEVYLRGKRPQKKSSDYRFSRCESVPYELTLKTLSISIDQKKQQKADMHAHIATSFNYTLNP